MLVSIVDLGTNTFSLIIADIHPGSYQILHRAREVVKLGEETIGSNRIAPEAFARGLQAMEKLSLFIKQYPVECIRAYATSAIREADNGLFFVTEVRKLTGIDVEIISGNIEADLIYYGNNMAVDLGEEPCLIMDIGGGSNEFILANKTQIFWKQSFKLGVARLLAKFKPENPITQETLQKINNYLEVELKELLLALQDYPVQKLVGSSGAFESVFQMIGKESLQKKQTAYEMALSDYHIISQKTIHSTLAEREQMPGLIPMRRDMIVLSYVLIDFILAHSQIKKMLLSTFSLKEGAMILFNKDKNDY